MADIPAAEAFQPGDLVAGKYRIESVIGQGGMGMVVAARHENLGQRVAIKLLLPEARKNEDMVARFLREGRSASAIRSEHVARVLDVDTLPDGTAYMVMEFLSGSDLGDLIVEGGLPVADAVGYVLQACEALAEAHSLGIVHRDLKPSNLFLTRRADGSPLVKVLDFGISKAAAGLDPGEARMTSTTAVMGSPLYMSPEQLRSAKNADARSDVWSLGAVLYELLTGKVVFEAESLTGLAAMIAMDPASPMRTHRADLPKALDEVVLRCLEKDPAKRWSNVGQLAAALAPFASSEAQVSASRVQRIVGGGDSSASIEPVAPARTRVGSATASAWARTATAPGRGRLVMFGVAAAALVGIGTAGTIALWPAGTTPQPDSSQLRSHSPVVSGAEPAASASAASPDAGAQAEPPAASASAAAVPELREPPKSTAAGSKRPPPPPTAATATPKIPKGGAAVDPLADPH